MVPLYLTSVQGFLLDALTSKNPGGPPLNKTDRHQTTTMSVPSKLVCKLDEYQCRNARCIPSKWRCDSDPDCPDKDDEDGCGDQTTIKVSSPVTTSSPNNVTDNFVLILSSSPSSTFNVTRGFLTNSTDNLLMTTSSLENSLDTLTITSLLLSTDNFALTKSPENSTDSLMKTWSSTKSTNNLTSTTSLQTNLKDNLTLTTGSPTYLTDYIIMTNSPPNYTDKFTMANSSPTISTDYTITTSLPMNSRDNLIITNSSPTNAMDKFTIIISVLKNSTYMANSFLTNSTDKLTMTTNLPTNITHTYMTTSPPTNSSNFTMASSQPILIKNFTTISLPINSYFTPTTNSQIKFTDSLTKTSLPRNLTLTTASPTNLSNSFMMTTSQQANSTDNITLTTNSPMNSTENLTLTSSSPMNSTDNLTLTTSSPMNSIDNLTLTTSSVMNLTDTLTRTTTLTIHSTSYLMTGLSINQTASNFFNSISLLPTSWGLNSVSTLTSDQQSTSGGHKFNSAAPTSAQSTQHYGPTTCYATNAVCIMRPDLCDSNETYEERNCTGWDHYCVNELICTSDGSHILNQRCGNQLECYHDWWLKTKPRSECMSYSNEDHTKTTHSFKCTFCCTENHCNKDPVPPQDTWFLL